MDTLRALIMLDCEPALHAVFARRIGWRKGVSRSKNVLAGPRLNGFLFFFPSTSSFSYILCFSCNSERQIVVLRFIRHANFLMSDRIWLKSAPLFLFLLGPWHLVSHTSWWERVEDSVGRYISNGHIWTFELIFIFDRNPYIKVCFI